MDVIQNLFCMNLGLDLLWSEDFLNNAFFVDKIGGAEDSDGLSAAGYLLAPAAEFLQRVVSVSAISGNCRPLVSANFFCSACLSLLTPIIS